MLQLSGFTFNPFQENTYLLTNEKKECWIVDPGMYDEQETKVFRDYLEKEGLKPQGILNTHTHIDHIFGVQALKNAYNLKFGIHRLDEIVLKYAKESALRFGMDIATAPVADFFIEAGKPLQLGADQLEVRLAPGHSPGSIVFYSPEGKWLIGGDVLFAGGIGRTDLPGGDHQTLIDSIRTQLFTLPDETVVYPGHGPATTIAGEKAGNPFLV